jgi:hypothetical protein
MNVRASFAPCERRLISERPRVALARARAQSLRVFLCIGGWLGVVGDAVSEMDA